MIDWSFRLGDLIPLIGFLGGGIAFAYSVRGNVETLALKLGFLTETVQKQSREIERIAELITTVVRFEERLKNLRDDVEALKRGEGYIITNRREK